MSRRIQFPRCLASLINLRDGSNVHLTAAADVTMPRPQSIKKLDVGISPTLFPLTSMCSCSDWFFVIGRRGDSTSALCNTKIKSNLHYQSPGVWRASKQAAMDWGAILRQFSIFNIHAPWVLRSIKSAGVSIIPDWTQKLRCLFVSGKLFASINSSGAKKKARRVLQKSSSGL